MRIRKALRPLWAMAAVVLTILAIDFASLPAKDSDDPRADNLTAPAGSRAATQHTSLDGFDAAILPNGRLVTPAGKEVSVGAPKPFALALSADGKTLATANSGEEPFSVTLIRNLAGPGDPTTSLVELDATFMGIAFSRDNSRFYASGGDDGVIWVGETDSGKITGMVNLNGAAHPIKEPVDPRKVPKDLFKGAFPGSMVVSKSGRELYVVDQAGFAVITIDTTRIETGVDSLGRILEPNNFRAVAGSARVGRHPFGIGASPDGRSLFVTNVGVFEYSHLTPSNPTGDPNQDYPLAYPGVGYPEETERDTTIHIDPVDPRNLPLALRVPGGIRVGYVSHPLSFLIPGLGDPNVPESSSVFVLSLPNGGGVPEIRARTKTGPAIGSLDGAIRTYGGSHPNAVAAGRSATYVANGNDDSISILDPKTHREATRVSLSTFRGSSRVLKGVQPVALALAPDGKRLYVAEAGVNAVAVLTLRGLSATLEGLIPTAWWPSAVQISADGRSLYVACANGRGAPPNNQERHGSPGHTTMGTLHIVPLPSPAMLRTYTDRVLVNNGFRPTQHLGSAPARLRGSIRHIVFINKENATHDLLLGDITQTRRGSPVEGEPRYSLGYRASPNHHELALQFTIGDNFFLEPSCSSDGHRWLTDTYPTEYEQTNWPAIYGGKRSDAGDDPNIFKRYPGRLDFGGAQSPEPNDYDEHGSVYLHLVRNGRSFINFGNGFEFSEVDEDGGTEPTGTRNHLNVPMEKVVRDNSDHLYANFNTHIPDAPQSDDPTRYTRYDRFRQIFTTNYIDQSTGECKLPDYVDLYYPNDHGGGAKDINPAGPPWSFTRFVQDNDDALGRTVELISHSACWKDTVIFVVEDDPQNGMDHVNAARSIFLAIGPWVKRQNVAKTHYSLSSIFKTVFEILGIPPLNQYDYAAADLRDIFADKPDFTPYDRTPIAFEKGAATRWLALSREIDFRHPDADAAALRRAILLSEGLPRAEK